MQRIKYMRKSHIEDSYAERLTQHSNVHSCGPMINNNLFSENLAVL